MNLQVFFDRLKVERINRGLNQDEMAEKVGVSKRSYCAYEAGETAPSAKLLAALAGMGVDVNYLLTGIEGSAQALLDSKQARLARAVETGLRFEEVRAMEMANDPTSIQAITALLQKCLASERAAVFNLLESIVQLREALAVAQPKEAQGECR